VISHQSGSSPWISEEQPEYPGRLRTRPCGKEKSWKAEDEKQRPEVGRWKGSLFILPTPSFQRFGWKTSATFTSTTTACKQSKVENIKSQLPPTIFNQSWSFTYRNL